MAYTRRVKSNASVMAILFVFGFVLAAFDVSCATILPRDNAVPAPTLRVPLEYDPTSNLYTAQLQIGTPAQTYRTLVDTGSAFLLLQRSAAITDDDSSTKQGFPPTKVGPNGKPLPRDKVHVSGSFTGTKSDGSGKSTKSSTDNMEFFTDVFDFTAASSNFKEVIVGTTTLRDLKGLDGILGLAPPFSKVAAGPSKPAGRKQRRGEQDTPPASPAGVSPNYDVSFLQSFLDEQSATPRYSSFYLAFNTSNADTPGGGELVFPSGDGLPANIPGYDSSAYFQVDPTTGSTFPKHAFWGIAHRPDLSFTMTGDQVDTAQSEDFVVDAVLLDSGTSGILAPRSEVDKIAKRLRSASQVKGGSQGDQVVSTQVDCSGSSIDMAFVFGGKRFSFPSIRPSLASKSATQGRNLGAISDPDTGADAHLMEMDATDAQDAVVGLGIGPWKSYSDPGGAVSASLGFVGDMMQAGSDAFDNYVSRWTKPDSSSIQVRRRNHRRRELSISLNADKVPSCALTVVGSEAVEHMFPRPAGSSQDLKVWILGQEFFQHNLVYHNIQHQTLTILPKSS